MNQKLITIHSGKVNDYIHLVDLYEFGMPRVLACFVAKFDDCTCILDCGSSIEIKKIIRYLRNNNIPLSSVKYLITTHHHFDHAGGMWKLYNKIKKYNPKVKILTNRMTKELLNDYEYHLNRAKRTYKEFAGEMRSIEENAFELFEPSAKFSYDLNSLEFLKKFTINGEEVKLCVLKTPGHTPDHQCSLFVRNGENEFLYAGEAAGTIYHSTKLITMPTSMPIYFNYKDFIASLTNLKKLKTPLQIGYTHFGVVSGKENVKYILEEQEEFLKQFRAKTIEYYNEKPETKYVFDKLASFFSNRSDVVGEDKIGLQNIVLGVVYGMMMDLGFRTLDESEKEQLKRFKNSIS